MSVEISNISNQLSILANGLKKEVQQNKALKRKAAKPLEVAMYFNAPKSKKTVIRKGKIIPSGALKRSIKFLPLRKTEDVFVGSDFRIAPHAHLVEFGFRHHTGEQVPGKFFAKKSYEQTKSQVLINLVELAKKEFEKYGKQLEING